MAEDRKETSEYNESLMAIQRLNDLWIGFSQSRENGYIQKAWDKLKSIEVELRFDANEIDKKSDTKFIKELDEINKSYGKPPGVILEIRRAVSKTITFTKDDPETMDMASCHETLMKKAILLKEIQQRSGKGSKYRDLESDDIE